MLRSSLFILLLAWSPLSVLAGDKPAVEVMILGTYHFENPGLDVHNVRADNVLGARRQTELQAIAAAIASFRPTRVMVEMVSDEPRRAVNSFSTFSEGMLKTDANESVQLGFRVARLVGLPEVNGIDVQASPDGESYYPYAKVVALARRLGREALLKEANKPIADLSQSFEQAQSTSSLAELLILGNAPETARLLHQPMFEFLAVADGSTQPGADLNARWYLRNAKIFANLLEISRPGDRVLVVYGFGHNYWLRHFVEGKSGFRLVEPRPFLEQAQRAIRLASP